MQHSELDFLGDRWWTRPYLPSSCTNRELIIQHNPAVFITEFWLNFRQIKIYPNFYQHEQWQKITRLLSRSSVYWRVAEQGSHNRHLTDNFLSLAIPLGNNEMIPTEKLFPIYHRRNRYTPFILCVNLWGVTRVTLCVSLYQTILARKFIFARGFAREFSIERRQYNGTETSTETEKPVSQ